MKKRLLAAVLCLAMVSGLVGCGQKETSNNDNDSARIAELEEELEELEAENNELREEIKVLTNNDTSSDTGKTNIDETTAETWGVCGADLTWYYANGVLTIRGTGDMADFSNKESIPWYSIRGKIQWIVIEQGCTTIGETAFYNCNNVNKLEVPDSVKLINTNALNFDSINYTSEMEITEKYSNISIIWNGEEYRDVTKFIEEYNNAGNNINLSALWGEEPAQEKISE